MTLGKRIRRARLAAGLSQVTLSGLIGVDQTTLSGWERDDGPEPRLGHAVRLAALTGAKLRWLATGVGASGLRERRAS